MRSDLDRALCFASAQSDEPLDRLRGVPISAVGVCGGVLHALRRLGDHPGRETMDDAQRLDEVERLLS
jgi:hypothetical protein